MCVRAVDHRFERGGFKVGRPAAKAPSHVDVAIRGPGVADMSVDALAIDAQMLHFGAELLEIAFTRWATEAVPAATP